MHQSRVEFSVGQLIHHRLFDYRGVIVDVDPTFQGSEEWYQQVARSRPPKNAPWYRVLVHGGGETYVAERNLGSDLLGQPIEHGDLEDHFGDFKNGAYSPRRAFN